MEERPYTPYVVDADEALFAKDATVAEKPEGVVSASESLENDAGASRGVARVPSQPLAPRWTLEGLELVAPEGEGFVTALAADLDRDEDRDAVAWVASADTPGAGRLLFFAGDAEGRLGAPRQVAELSNLFPEGCSAEVALEQVGTVTVAVQASAARCPEPPPSGAISRWVAVVSPAEEPALRQVITVREPPRGERLVLSVDAEDRDDDGRDDLAVKVALEGGPEHFEPGARATAELRWFDRQAGLSRDADEPEASLRPQATRQMVRAERKGEAANVASSTRQLMRLYAALCEEAGAPLVDFATGPLRCGTSRALEDAVLAQVRAASTLGDPLRALAAIERFSQWPTAHTKARRREAERILRKLVTVVEAEARTLEAVPLRLPGPSFSPLAFDEAGVLLVMTPNGVTRATIHGEEWPSEEDEPWPLAVMSADGRYRWAGSFDPCDQLAYRLRFVSVEGEPHEVRLPLLTPAHGPKRCAGEAETHLLGARSGNVEAIVAGEPWLLKVGAAGVDVKPLASSALGGITAGRGSAKSPDGRYLALGSRRGVLVRDASKWTLWQLEGSDDDALEACTVSNDAQAAACVRKGRVILAHRPAER